MHCTNSYIAPIFTYSLPLSCCTCPQTMVSACHRPWYTGGKHIPLNDSLKLVAGASNDCLSSLDLTTTQQVMVLISKYVSTTHTIENSHVEYPTISSIEVSYKLLTYYVSQCIRSRTLDRISYKTHHQRLVHIDSPTCTATQIDGNASISNRYRTLQGSCRLYTMHIISHHLLVQKTHLFLIIIFLSNLSSTSYRSPTEKASTPHIPARMLRIPPL